MLVGPSVGLAIGALVAVLAVAEESVYGMVIAAVAAVSAAGWALAVRRRLSRTPVALTRQGDLLIGGELPEPLPVAGATFSIVSEREGGWLVLLDAGGRKVRMQARAWSLPEGRRPTRSAVGAALTQLGIGGS